MCEPVTIASIASAVVAGAGTVVSHRAASQAADATKRAEGNESRRQNAIQTNERRLQEQQRADALESRKGFQENTLGSFTREKMDADADSAAGGLSAALASAGDRAIAKPTGGDATAATGTVAVSGDPLPSQGGSSYKAAFRDAMTRARGINLEQSTAQGALAALGKARQRGNDRLTAAGQQIMLANSRLGALNRPQAAFNVMKDSSRQLYGADAIKAQNAGAGLALAGSTLSSLGQAGYSYASGYQKKPATPVT